MAPDGQAQAMLSRHSLASITVRHSQGTGTKAKTMLRAVEWRLLDHTAAEPVTVGDLVSVDAGGMPIYRVAKVAAGHVWLNGERDATSREMPLDLFRWRGAPAMQAAA